jgi:hypothetical protein
MSSAGAEPELEDVGNTGKLDPTVEAAAAFGLQFRGRKTSAEAE